MLSFTTNCTPQFSILPDNTTGEAFRDLYTVVPYLAVLGMVESIQFQFNSILHSCSQPSQNPSGISIPIRGIWPCTPLVYYSAGMVNYLHLVYEA